ncbi:response regulator transcription factor [Actinokineospora auranticolor]|uniref:HTH luxR-type domain-containing protein n=1 Tax=Actinokineospora auranticolor TaxID=155976 RepID=A0A2S6GMX0_9PSEU|nr:response regulator transcription factor [Actinokineospora auranticolor]PPK66530.1 hypothetical protein CLV40_110234 [Actinokineospora auranticolor]
MINAVGAAVPQARASRDGTGGATAGQGEGVDAFHGARRLLIEALELSMGQRRTAAEPRDAGAELRAELRARPAGTSVLVACSAQAELTEPLGMDPCEFLRAEVLDRGHRLTLLHHDLAALAAPDQHTLAGLVAAGAEVRVLARTLPRAVLVGDDVALLPADTGGGTLVRTPEVVRALRQTHATLRDLAVDFTELTGAVIALVGPSSLADVLGRLCAGMKDESAARQMRVSVRTYRRYVASILKSLNVTSRFEAGMRLSEIGLTDLARRHAARATPGPRTAGSCGLGGPGGAPEDGVEQAEGEHEG